MLRLAEISVFPIKKKALICVDRLRDQAKASDSSCPSFKFAHFFRGHYLIATRGLGLASRLDDLVFHKNQVLLSQVVFNLLFVLARLDKPTCTLLGYKFA